ncbi:phage major capsid protein, partial [Sinorhizobium meliloti]
MPDPVEKTAEQLALEVKAEFDKTMNQVKEIAEKALAEAAKGVGMTDDLKEKADESLLKM